MQHVLTLTRNEITLAFGAIAMRWYALVSRAQFQCVKRLKPEGAPVVSRWVGIDYVRAGTSMARLYLYLTG